MLSQHKKIYWKNSDLETGQTKTSCGRKIRQLGKQDIRTQLSEEYAYDDFWDYFYHPCCDDNSPCSSCKIKYLAKLGFDIDKGSAFVFTTGHKFFLNDLISVSSEYLWAFSYDVFSYSITHENIEFLDIKAFIDFHMDPSIEPIEWLIHPDAGIRALAGKKYVRTEQ